MKYNMHNNRYKMIYVRYFAVFINHRFNAIYFLIIIYHIHIYLSDNSCTYIHFNDMYYTISKVNKFQVSSKIMFSYYFFLCVPHLSTPQIIPANLKA